MSLLYSVLDLCPILEGGDAGDAFYRARDLAQHVERWGYHRFWLAEHHNIPGIASAATSVVIGHVAAGTRKIRVGSGGIMLPNHAPLAIAEQFGTLESLFPGRIDLGIGRAPGGDPHIVRALRRGLHSSGDSLPQDLAELRAFFRPATPAQPVRAIPGAGLRVPVYLLGSSDFSARLAAQLGLPFAFASHFAPDYLLPALELYRREFQPSAELAQPHVLVGANIFAAETDEEARQLFTSLERLFLNLFRGTRRELAPPEPAGRAVEMNQLESAQVHRMTRVSLVGSPATVKEQLRALLAETRADEIIGTAQIYDHAARLRSFEIFAEVCRELAHEEATAGEELLTR